MKKLIAIVLLSVLGAALTFQNAEAGGWRKPHSVTLWWVIFNHPENCTFNPGGAEQCGMVDVFGQAFLDSIAAGDPDPTLIAPNLAAGLAVVYATGDRTTLHGKVRLVASIYRSPAGLNLGAETIVDPLGLNRALDNVNAEIHLVVRDHGDVVRRDYEAQILSFLDPYCVDPLLRTGSGANVCADKQAAVYGANQAGEKDVYTLDPVPERVPGASATLIRNGDVIQAIVETHLDTRN